MDSVLFLDTEPKGVALNVSRMLPQTAHMQLCTHTHAFTHTPARRGLLAQGLFIR